MCVKFYGKSYFCEGLLLAECGEGLGFPCVVKTWKGRRTGNNTNIGPQLCMDMRTHGHWVTVISGYNLTA